MSKSEEQAERSRQAMQAQAEAQEAGIVTEQKRNWFPVWTTKRTDRRGNVIKETTMRIPSPRLRWHNPKERTDRQGKPLIDFRTGEPKLGVMDGTISLEAYIWILEHAEEINERLRQHYKEEQELDLDQLFAQDAQAHEEAKAAALGEDNEE